MLKFFFPKKYFFTLTKGSGKGSVELYLRLKNGKFETVHALHSQYLFSLFPAAWYWLLFNLPSWIKENGSMFKYEKTTGAVQLRMLTDEYDDFFLNTTMAVDFKTTQALSDYKALVDIFKWFASKKCNGEQAAIDIIFSNENVCIKRYGYVVANFTIENFFLEITNEIKK